MPKRDDTIYKRIPPLDPNSAWDYNAQLRQLYGAYFDMLAQLRYQVLSCGAGSAIRWSVSTRPRRRT